MCGILFIASFGHEDHTTSSCGGRVPYVLEHFLPTLKARGPDSLGVSTVRTAILKNNASNS